MGCASFTNAMSGRAAILTTCLLELRNRIRKTWLQREGKRILHQKELLAHKGIHTQG
jgi:hypothetical protein